MAVHTQSAPSHLYRWLMAPAAVGALLATLITALRRRAAEPSLPRMSDEWMRSHGSPRDWWR